MIELTFHLTSPQTPEQWRDYYALRWRILRAPWGQPPGSERDDFEDAAWHVMAVAGQDHVVGVGRLHKLADRCAQIRYMAVADDYQGQGIGGLILQALEAKAMAWQIKEIVLNARRSVMKFYSRSGYSETAEGELLFGEIAHVRMQKIIT